MKYVVIWLIRLYQKYLSPLKRYRTCRFTPTCSSYAIEAFLKRGFFVGFGLTVWRILRCNPFCAGGYDPVPERRPRNKWINETEDTDICNAPGSNKTGEDPDSGKQKRRKPSRLRRLSKPSRSSRSARSSRPARSRRPARSSRSARSRRSARSSRRQCNKTLNGNKQICY